MGSVTIGTVQSELIVRDPINQSKINIYAVIGSFKVTNQPSFLIGKQSGQWDLSPLGQSNRSKL
jgi:hypothetical protein